MTDTLISMEPATGEQLWQAAIGDIDAEVAVARDNWADWAARSHSYRIETLRRFVNVVREKREEFADLIARETGKPLWEARTEVDAVSNKVEISVTAYFERTPNQKNEGEMGAHSALRHKPHGVLAVLGPFNFPAHLPNGHMVPALIAGNAVVFKPSEKTPAVGEYLIKCYHEAGVPEGVARLVIGGPEEGRALASHDGIDGLLFTGSARAGMALHRQFGDRPDKILALELGGNNPLVVWDAPDIEAAATMAIQSAYTTAGQRCTAGRRLIVKDGEHEALIETIAKLAKRIIVDEPHANPAPFMGPVIDNDSATIVNDAFLGMLLKGGKPIVHMRRPEEDKPFLTPGLIDVTDIADRPDEEVFGPLLQIIRVPDFETALAEANNTRFGLSASLISGSPDLYDTFWANIRAGIVNWNNPTNGASSAAPFGGVGFSGNHRPSAFYAADYCAYPVASAEAPSARASIGIGLKDPHYERKAEPES
ncbi:MAG: succinylglutamate-semialdehyde dehydrogenase [Sphingomonadaceae bacterium]|nr:succinylglutamate-semialdehyde dehydrogenase [Sphingomonadaceae bacterium]